MKILLIWGADYPWDVRIEKIARSLFLNGHEVHLLCRNLKRLPKKEKWEFGCIHRLTPLQTPSLSGMLSLPVFLNPIWFKELIHIIRQNRIDLVLVREIALSLSALLAGKLTRIPVLMDMAENYPAFLEEIWHYEPFRLQNVLLRNPRFARWVERLATRFMDHILVVVEESRQRLISTGIDASKVSVVSNTPDIDFIENFSDSISESDTNALRDRYILIYIGGLEYSRGLEQVVHAMKNVVTHIPESLLFIIGQGNSYDDLQSLTLELGLTQHVKLRGWVEPDRAPALLKRASVGIIPHHITNHTNDTIPNKIFDYMYFNLPVIASECKPIKRILEEEGCGLTFSTTEELAQKIMQLRDETTRKEMASRGKTAVLSRYNWRVDSAVLNMVIKEFS